MESIKNDFCKLWFDGKIKTFESVGAAEYFVKEKGIANFHIKKDMTYKSLPKILLIHLFEHL